MKPDNLSVLTEKLDLVRCSIFSCDEIIANVKYFVTGLTFRYE